MLKHCIESVRGHLTNYPSQPIIQRADAILQLAPVTQLSIPSSLQASLLARLDRLAPVREIAQIGATLGRRFTHELISAVVSLSEQQLDLGLEQLVSAELISRRGTGPNAEYTFKHALVQDAAYSTLLRSRRAQLHGQIAAVLEARFPEIVQMQPELLARHCTEAGLIQKAIQHCLKAGQQAMARSAMVEAETQLRKGLELLSNLPDGNMRQQHELNLLITLGQALIAIRGYGATESSQLFSRARQIAEELKLPPEHLMPILYGLGAFRFLRGELQEAKHYCQEVRDLAAASDDPRWKYFGQSISGIMYFYAGEFINARLFFDEALSLWDPMFRAPPLPSADDRHIADLIHLSRTLLCLGYLDKARSLRHQAVAEARPLPPFTLAFALYQAWVNDCLLEGEESAKTLLEAAEEVVAISTEQGFVLWLGIGYIMRGWCLSAAGQSAEAIQLMLQGIATARATGCILIMPFFLTLLAEVYAKAGQVEEGLSRLGEAANMLETITQERWAEAEMHHTRAKLLLFSKREHAVAEDFLRKAIAVAQHQNGKFWELRAATSLARLWHDQGKRTEARDLLAPVYGWFTEGFDAPVLQGAKALLDELM